ncbi:ROK family protein [uncultured Cohaesibacter sp.]|uniref:ROK family protein n=1 Tax=uncultured Cohaesibacter sp. TaxID=1002546 RepID=UPI00292F2A24|nr:ROK family protein [uncultured Cohaesibacter sp.]
MIVCFDIGGTSIKGAYAQDPKTLSLVPRIPTPAQDYDAFVAALKRVIDDAPQKPDCVSISIAGILHPADGKAIVANIPCLHGTPMRERLTDDLGLQVIVANDADCFALAEAELGAGRGHRIVFGVILGTGVGGGLVIDGRLINENGGPAGEWGHGPVACTSAGNPPMQIPRFHCGCGVDGCLDATCSARGLEKLHKHIHGDDESAEDILAFWQADDAKAQRTLEIYIELLTGPLAMIVNMTGTSVIPVGGGLSNVPALIEAIDKATRSKTLLRPTEKLVIPAVNKIEPGIIGAAVHGHSVLRAQRINV